MNILALLLSAIITAFFLTLLFGIYKLLNSHDAGDLQVQEMKEEDLPEAAEETEAEDPDRTEIPVPAAASAEEETGTEPASHESEDFPVQELKETVNPPEEDPDLIGQMADRIIAEIMKSLETETALSAVVESAEAEPPEEPKIQEAEPEAEMPLPEEAEETEPDPAAEELPESLQTADLPSQLDEIRNAVEELFRMPSVAEEEPAETESLPKDSPVLPREEEAETSMPFREWDMENCTFGAWQNACGNGEPVLFIFRSKPHYDDFVTAVQLLYEQQLKPVSGFYTCLCMDPGKGDHAVDEVSGWFFDHGCDVSRILCDTLASYADAESCFYGTGTGMLRKLQFPDMNESAREAIRQKVLEAEADHVRCIFEDSSLTILAADCALAEALLKSIQELCEQQNLSFRIEDQQDPSEVCGESGAFAQAIAAAIAQTFPSRKTAPMILPASEWRGSLQGYEAIWYSPAEDKAVSFYLNLLCLQ